MKINLLKVQSLGNSELQRSKTKKDIHNPVDIFYVFKPFFTQDIVRKVNKF